MHTHLPPHPNIGPTGSRLHSEARDLLDFIGDADWLQIAADNWESPEDMKRWFKREWKYEPTQNAGQVTLGWGRKADAGKANAPTTAMIVIGDDIWTIGIGSRGIYSATIVWKDVRKRPVNAREVAAHLAYVPVAMSGKCKELLPEPLLHRWQQLFQPVGGVRGDVSERMRFLLGS